jgi:hypothetical protein
VSILHDPSLGVFGDGLPALPAEWRAVFDPVVWGISAVAAVAIVYGMRGGAPRRRGEDDEGEGMGEGDDGTGGTWSGPTVAGGPPPQPPMPPAPPAQPAWPPRPPSQGPPPSPQQPFPPQAFPPQAFPTHHQRDAQQPPAGTDQDIVEWEQ